MVNTLILDTDGMVIKREMYFSERLSKDLKVPLERILPFFQNEFQRCLTGSADLKEEIAKYLPGWSWKKSVDDLLAYWFNSESTIDKDLLSEVNKLRTKKVKCYLDTNNEKYRTNYLTNGLGLGKNFDGIFSSCQLRSKKPERGFWQAIHDQLNIPKQAILVWDDDEENVMAAQNFGFQAKRYTDTEDFKRFFAL